MNPLSEFRSLGGDHLSSSPLSLPCFLLYILRYYFAWLTAYLSITFSPVLNCRLMESNDSEIQHFYKRIDTWAVSLSLSLMGYMILGKSLHLKSPNLSEHHCSHNSRGTMHPSYLLQQNLLWKYMENTLKIIKHYRIVRKHHNLVCFFLYIVSVTFYI